MTSSLGYFQFRKTEDPIFNCTEQFSEKGLPSAATFHPPAKSMRGFTDLSITAEIKNSLFLGSNLNVQEKKRNIGKKIVHRHNKTTFTKTDL